MPAPVNGFKVALAQGSVQIGLWLALANAYSAEICSGAGYDWLLIDGEHAPNDIASVLAQLQALKGSGSHAVVRPPMAEPWLLKQILDLGVQSLLIPMIESGAQARATVKAVRYPPQGIRGIGAALARASAFNGIPDYLQTANDEICLLLQIESQVGLMALDEISTTDGVDGVFIGPADLAADMGFIGQPGAAAVRDAVDSALRRVRSHGRPAGVLTSDLSLARHYRETGANFIAIGSDVALLSGSAARRLQDFLDPQSSQPASPSPAAY